MPVELVKYEMQVPKESKELLDPVVGLIKHFKDGGDIEGAAVFLPAVMKAVEGLDKIPEELKTHTRTVVAYSVEKIWGIFE